MTVAMDVLDPRRDPEPAGWPGYVRDQRLHPPWDYGLMAVESRAAANPTLLALAKQDGGIVAAFAAMLCRPGRPSPGTAGGRTGWRPSWVEVQHPWLSGFPGWAFRADLDLPARAAVLRAFERAVCRFAGIGCLGLLYRNVPPDEEPVVARRISVAKDTVLGVSELPNRFSSVADWVTSLSRGRRHALRGQLRKVAADHDLVVRFGPARRDLDGQELAAMLNRHRAGFGRLKFDSRSPVSAGYLAALVGRPDVHTLTYHDRRGRLLAFATMLDHPATPVYQHWAARARDDGGRQHLYFDSYARMVRHVVEGGRESLSAGRGMPELKQSLGFVERPLRVLVVPRVAAG